MKFYRYLGFSLLFVFLGLSLLPLLVWKIPFFSNSLFRFIEKKTNSQITYVISSDAISDFKFSSRRKLKSLEFQDARFSWNYFWFLNGVLEAEEIRLKSLSFLFEKAASSAVAKKLFPSFVRSKKISPEKIFGEIIFPNYSFKIFLKDAELVWNRSLKRYDLSASDGEAIVLLRDSEMKFKIEKIVGYASERGAAIKELKLSNAEDADLLFSVLWGLEEGEFILNLIVHSPNFDSFALSPMSGISLSGNLKGEFQLQGSRETKSIGAGFFKIRNGYFANPWSAALFDKRENSLNSVFFTEGILSFSFDENSFLADKMDLMAKNFSLESSFSRDNQETILLDLKLGLSEELWEQISFLKQRGFFLNDDGYYWGHLFLRRKNNKWKNNFLFEIVKGSSLSALKSLSLPFILGKSALGMIKDGGMSLIKEKDSSEFLFQPFKGEFQNEK